MTAHSACAPTACPVVCTRWRGAQGEEGIDAGGVTREWYQVMAREMFNPNLALFVAVPEGGSTFQPNPNSHVQNDRGISHLDYFRFAGRVVGKVRSRVAAKIMCTN